MKNWILCLGLVVVGAQASGRQVDANKIKATYERIGTSQNLLTLLLSKLTAEDYQFLKTIASPARLPRLRSFTDHWQVSADGLTARVEAVSAKHGRFKVNQQAWQLSLPMNVKKDLTTLQRLAEPKSASSQLWLNHAYADPLALLAIGTGIYLAAGIAAYTDCQNQQHNLPCAGREAHQACEVFGTVWPVWFWARVKDFSADQLYRPTSLVCDKSTGKLTEASFANAKGDLLKFVHSTERSPYEYVTLKKSGTAPAQMQSWFLTQKGVLDCFAEHLENGEVKSGGVIRESKYAEGQLLARAHSACADPKTENAYRSEMRNAGERMASAGLTSSNHFPGSP